MKKKFYSIVSFISAIFVGICAMFLPPIGIIDNSVLWFIAQLLLFTSSVIGVDFSIKKL